MPALRKAEIVGYELLILSVSLLRLLRMVVVHALSHFSLVVIAAILLSYNSLRLFTIAKIRLIEAKVSKLID